MIMIIFQQKYIKNIRFKKITREKFKKMCFFEIQNQHFFYGSLFFKRAKDIKKTVSIINGLNI